MAVPLLFAALAGSSLQARYDPMESTTIPVTILERDARAKGSDRKVPLRIYFIPPAERHRGQAPGLPVILFSHGLGGTNRLNSFLGEHWARRGYVAVFMQHPGSDESVWKGLPMREVMPAMRRAASGANLALRFQDVRTTLDALAGWNGSWGDLGGDELGARLDLTRVGIGGHSFGARTAQGMTGQSAGRLASATDDRIDAALILSPSPGNGDPKRNFGGVKVPWMLMTGTEDVSPIGGETVASRLTVFPALPETIDRYQIVFDGADHGAFTDAGRAGVAPRSPRVHKAMTALSTAFFDAHLRQIPEARAWLFSPATKVFMIQSDDWSAKQAGTR
ncbi:MAG: hypothetical protein MH204_07940, partial [Fimbriimonadaceae bacterium]|nr:hypothetical protein [Fimbriimonadaceae bacterium]